MGTGKGNGMTELEEEVLLYVACCWLASLEQVWKMVQGGMRRIYPRSDLYISRYDRLA